MRKSLASVLFPFLSSFAMSKRNPYSKPPPSPHFHPHPHPHSHTSSFLSRNPLHALPRLFHTPLPVPYYPTPLLFPRLSTFSIPTPNARPSPSRPPPPPPLSQSLSHSHSLCTNVMYSSPLACTPSGLVLSVPAHLSVRNQNLGGYLHARQFSKYPGLVFALPMLQSVALH
ncbi:hypothetical protein EDB81DRAFT_388860 [Dactylonectria macrodidyma]|uniref:Uncharacterized protein n=1 Tax=Dactylonectria macrodidyma TaxID=307937 RepID=A0A9P9FAF1_9HYPO|nr:hypothetical protein EDB81DRAFT_388860 [Dactylonectria macrodidyma]